MDIVSHQIVENTSQTKSRTGAVVGNFIKKNIPRVSVLIPCYEARSFVPEAIKCALNQDYAHVEIIVAPDDGQTYRFLREEFSSPQLRVIDPGSASKTGPGAARNRAIDASSGQFISILDADDWISPTYLSELMAVAMKEGAAVAPTRYVSWENRSSIRVPPMHNKLLTLSGFGQLLSSIHPVIHRDFEIGYCDGFAEDVVHDGLVIAKFGTVRIVDSVSYDLRLRQGSECNNGADAEKAIQNAYSRRISQILNHPTQIGAQCLGFEAREAFANLFRFRATVSKAYSESGAADYNAWVAGKEADLWDQFEISRREQLVLAA